MSGAILLLKYMPDQCIDCPMSGYSSTGTPYCKAKKKSLDTFVSKPKWCPIKDIPKAQVYTKTCNDLSYTDGWNACLNEIL